MSPTSFLKPGLGLIRKACDRIALREPFLKYNFCNHAIFRSPISRHITAGNGWDTCGSVQSLSVLCGWHSSVKRGSRHFEVERHKVSWCFESSQPQRIISGLKRHGATKDRRRREKEQAASHSFSAQTFACAKCSRVWASRIGLYSHQPAHKNCPPSLNPSLRGINNHYLRLDFGIRAQSTVEVI